MVKLHLLEFAGKVFVRGACLVVRHVQVVLLVKSCISLETLRICDQSCPEGTIRVVQLVRVVQLAKLDFISDTYNLLAKL